MKLQLQAYNDKTGAWETLNRREAPNHPNELEKARNELKATQVAWQQRYHPFALARFQIIEA